MKRPIPKPGLLPKVSPILVIVTEPITIPTRKEDPISPSLIEDAHSKLN
jgi:hypothetical protein